MVGEILDRGGNIYQIPLTLSATSNHNSALKAFDENRAVLQVLPYARKIVITCDVVDMAKKQ